MKDSTPILELQSVSCTYRSASAWCKNTGNLVVRDISLSVRQGETLGIVGESGSGKTTLIKTMLGLLKPVSGRVLLNGQPREKLSRREQARLQQIVFQDPYSSLNPSRTVLETVAEPLHIHRTDTPSERLNWARELCGLVGLSEDHINSRPRHLSGGQRQRVAIARALALKPSVLICDEPTSALDVSVQAQILNLLLELQERLGLAIVFVTHNLAVVEHLSTHLAVLCKGEMVEQGEVAQVLKAPREAYTRMLLDSVLGLGKAAALANTPEPAIES